VGADLAQEFDGACTIRLTSTVRAARADALTMGAMPAIRTSVASTMA
jgi:hypothetical protein